MTTRFTACLVAGALAWLHLTGESRAGEPVATASTTRSFKDIIKNYSLRLGLESAGPLRFNDTPDQTLEATTVFQYGGRFAFLFGSESEDTNRLGLAVGHSFVARSESRTLRFTDLYAMYETGFPLVLQLHAGYGIASGTKGFADEYGGLYGAAALRYSFDKPDSPSSFRVSPGLVAKSYLKTGDVRNSSFFVGAQIEFTYNSNN